MKTKIENFIKSVMKKPEESVAVEALKIKVDAVITSIFSITESLLNLAMKVHEHDVILTKILDSIEYNDLEAKEATNHREKSQKPN